MEKYFSSKKQVKFYTPGEEIGIDKKGLFKHYSFKNDSFNTCKNRTFFAIFGFICVYLCLSIRLFDVCLSNDFKIKSKTIDEAKLHSLSSNPIKRADITDRHGIVLATSLPTVNLYANPKKVLDVEKSAQNLARILPDMLYEDILSKLKSRAKFVYIKRNLSPSQQYQINALGIPGLEFEEGEKRVYPHKSLFSHLLGSTDIDNYGIMGIERALDERLTSSDIPLKLSVDAGIQDTIKTFLSEGMQQFNASGATAILMDVKTSEIISMVSLPDFDPNDNKMPSPRAQFNFATLGAYEPGSVFKVFNAAMGLESGKIKVSDSFDATKPLKLRYNTIKDYRGENRWLSLPEVLIYSSNIGSAQIALRVGKKQQQEFMKNLGFFSNIDIEIAERAKPIVPKRWGEETVATVAYGYGLSVTPMHLITAFSAIVNGGIYHTPSLLNKENPDTGHRVVSKKTSAEMIDLLRQVVTTGSGRRANVTGYEVAGKTGTANKLINGKYIDKKVMTTFVSTFPASNPQYALLVMLDEPQATKETWGFVTSGWNTVPTTNKIITAIAPQLNIEGNIDLDEKRKFRIIEASFEKK